MNLILIGLPKSGKTTLGRKLAVLLGLSFIDTDDKIAKKYGKSVRDIFKEEGRKKFRKIENDLLYTLKGVKNSVISLGGGTPLDQKDHFFIKSLGTVIYVKTPVEVIWKRMKLEELPSYLSLENPYQSFLTLVSEREKVYEILSDLQGVNDE